MKRPGWIRLHERLRYDQETGVLRWRKTPPGPRRTRAGWLRPDGYRAICFGGVQYLEHHVIWCLMTGRWAPAEIDHMDGVRSNNRWGNLRRATHGQNAQNQRISRANTSGFMGVSRGRRNMWRATIKFAGVYHAIGQFETPEAASAAYLAAKKRLHTFNPVPRKS